jgi:hypothetical protein
MKDLLTDSVVKGRSTLSGTNFNVEITPSGRWDAKYLWLVSLWTAKHDRRAAACCRERKRSEKRRNAKALAREMLLEKTLDDTIPNSHLEGGVW